MFSRKRASIHVLLAGGTGLTGGLLTDRLIRRADIGLDSIVRTPRRAVERAVDFDALVVDPTLSGTHPVDAGVSCLGTTIRAAGPQQPFRRVDRQYVVAVARAARARGRAPFHYGQLGRRGRRKFLPSGEG